MTRGKEYQESTLGETSTLPCSSSSFFVLLEHSGKKKGTIRELACRKNPHNQVTENKTKPEEMKYENSTTQNLLK